MSKTFNEPAPFSEAEYVPIAMTPVESHQIAAVGYDASRKTLQVSFTRGSGAIYQYPNVDPKVHTDFMAAESKGAFFGQHIKALPFQKFKAPQAA